MTKPKIPRGIPPVTCGVREKPYKNGVGNSQEMRDALDRSLERRGVRKTVRPSRWGE